jgi:hypothetical protein
MAMINRRQKGVDPPEHIDADGDSMGVTVLQCSHLDDAGRGY